MRCMRIMPFDAPDSRMRVVITGGPGGGKTTLLREFGRRGFATVEDTPRAIIRSRRALGLSPRPSPLEFAEQVLGRDVESYWQNSGQALTFFDRGVLDALAMIAHAAPQRGAVGAGRVRLVGMRKLHPFLRHRDLLPTRYVR